MKKDGKIDWQKRAEEVEENWKRALADYKNLVRRTEEERVLIGKFANTDLLIRLLPALDLMERAARHSGDAGVRMAADEVRRVLSEEGLTVIDPRKGEQFDEKVHECGETVDGGKSGLVAEVVEVGYKWRDGLVLRPAKVKVYKQSL